jgi:predicted nucleic acid-binding protein
VSVFVVDASVVLKWFVPEVHSAAARRLLEHDHQYLAPDLVFAETTNAVWKKVLRGELSPADGQALVTDMETIAVETVPCRALAKDAYALATATGRSVYDAMYLALAVRLDTRMLTADERLAKALAATPAAGLHIQTVQHFHGR